MVRSAICTAKAKVNLSDLRGGRGEMGGTTKKSKNGEGECWCLESHPPTQVSVETIIYFIFEKIVVQWR